MQIATTQPMELSLLIILTTLMRWETYYVPVEAFTAAPFRSITRHKSRHVPSLDDAFACCPCHYRKSSGYCPPQSTKRTPQQRALPELFTNDFIVSSVVDDIQGLSPSDSTPIWVVSNTTNWIIFLLGLFPFAWATIEFWRRIAVGEPFGTGTDSVVIRNTIGKDNEPKSSRGRRFLGAGALVVAYSLFIIASGVLALVFLAVWTTGIPDPP